MLKIVLALIALVFLTVAAVAVCRPPDTLRAAAFTECSTLGGTLIISADDRYICVPDAVEVGE